MAKHLLSLLFLCCALLCSTLSLHAEIVTVNVPTAGTLSAALTSAGINTSTVTSLKITGNLKSTDFVGSGYGYVGILQTMTTWNLTYLDLSEASIEGYAIPDGAFSSSMSTPKLINIILPNSVTSIGNGAFQRCSALTSVTIPESVTSIGNGAFQDCSALTSITIPNKVTSIGASAFLRCSALTSITIPSSVTSIGDNAFTVTPCSVTVDAANPNYSSEYGVLYNKGKSILMHGFTTKTSYVIPSSVTTINPYAFYNCKNLTSITIPNSVTIIGEYAFGFCTALTSIIIPNSVTTINNGTFHKCDGLTSITIPNSVETIEQYSFNCNSTNLTINEYRINSPSIRDNISSSFASSPSTQTLHVPVGSMNSYTTAGWGNYCTITDDLQASTLNTSAAISLPCTAGETATVNVSSNTYWKYTAPTGLSVNTGSFSGYGNTTLTIAATSDNTSTSPRTFEIQLKTDDNNVSKTITVTQAGALPTVTSISPTSGTILGGTSVTITGTNLTGATAVKFGSANATSYAVNSAIQITAVSPAGAAGAVDITVTNAGGTSATSAADKFTYTNPVISVTGVTAGGLAAAIAAAGGDLATVASLTVTGTIDARDFKILRDNMPLLATLDLSGATIVAGTNIDGTNGAADYSANGIPPNAFSDGFMGKTSLTSVSLPSTTTSIAGMAFNGCSNLTGSLTIPKSVNSIGFMAFGGCSKISSINAYGATPGSIALGPDVFSGTSTSSCVLHVPVGTKDAYAAADQWKAFMPNIVDDLAIAPAATTAAASAITSAGAILNGTVNAYGASTAVTFEYGTSTSYGAVVTATSSPVMGTSATAVSYTLTGLTPNTTYHYRVIGVNSEGTTNGGDIIFKTSANPVISVSGITAGGLSAAITTAGGDLATVTSLTVTGTIDARDFKTMRDAMPKLATLDISGATIVSGTSIPGTNGIKDYPANEIPEYAFYNTGISEVNTSLTSISLPSSVTSIGNNAFQYCSGLTGSLTIPSSLTSIGNNAFLGCSSFVGSLTIPSTLTTIGNNAFFNSGVLFTVNGANPNYSSEDDVLFNKDKTILIQCPISKTGSYTIPSSVTSIGESAFYNCYYITGSLTIPSLVTSIGKGAFTNCIGLTGSLTIPASVTSIGSYAFYGCSSISSINAHATTPGSIILKDYVFVGIPTGISLHVPPGTKALYEAAEQWKDFLPNIVDDLIIAPAATTTAASSVTSTGATLNGSINANGASTTVTFEYGLTTSYGTVVAAAQSPVTGVSATAVSYALSGLTPHTTYHYRVVGVNSEGTTNGGDMTFTTLASPVITVSGVTAGGLSAAIVAAGGDLATVTDLTVTGTIDARDFKAMRDAMPKLATLNLSGATIAAYTGAEGTVSDNVTYPANEISQYAFHNKNNGVSKTSLTSITFPSGITSIGNYAFSECWGFTGSLTIPSSVTSIGESAFRNCSGFTGPLTIGSSVISIGVSAFEDCSGFTGSLTIPSSVTSIGNCAFSACWGFTGSLTIPSSVTSIGNFAFSECRDFTGSLTIGSSVTSIGVSAFQNCANISSIKAYGATPDLITLGSTVFNGMNKSTCVLHVPIGTKTLYAEAEQWKDFLPNIVEDLAIAPAATTTAASSVTSTGATLNGSINANGASTAVTFEYGLTTSYGTSVAAVQSPITGASATAVSYALSGLTPHTTYHYRVVGVNSEGTTNGGDMTFTTKTPPTITGISPTSGSTLGGTTVTITGTNLTDATAVKFGTTAATSYSVNSATQITATAPARSAGVVDITVSTAGGTSATSSADQFTYVAIPVISVSGVTAGGLPAAIVDAGGDLATVTDLTVTGTIDARDFKAMRDAMPKLAKLNLSGATIVAYTGPEGTVDNADVTYPANEIPQFAFCTLFYVAKTSLTSITLPSGITSIGLYAFCNCVNLTGSLVLPTGLTSIGSSAFNNCSGFTGSLIIPSSVTSIGSSAFNNCSGFTGSLTIPSSVTSIENDAFSDCRGFTGSLSIPSSVTSIGNNAFNNCSGFTGSLTIPSSVTSIGSYAFRNCSGFTGSLTIGSSVASIGRSAFGGCSGFNGSLTIPSSVTSIERNAFGNCSQISSINANGTVPGSITLGSDVFHNIPKGSCKLVVPASSYLDYSAAEQWRDFFFINNPSPATLTTFSTTAGKASDSQTVTFSVSPTMLDMIITAPTGYEVRESGTSTFGSSVVFTSPTGDIPSKSIEVRIAATAAENNLAGNLVCTSTATTTQKSVALSGTVLLPIPTVSGVSPTSGSTVGGTTVTITGTNLTGVTAVKFGSANATGFTVNSDTQITATAPARSAGSVDITVTTAGGTSATSTSDQFTYVVAPTATTNAATSITATGATLNGSINANNASTTVTFEYGLDTSYGTIVTADQSPVTGSTATPVSKAITGLTAGTTYHYRVTGINAGGTANGSDQSFTTPKQSQTITFNALPVKTYGDADFTPEATASSGLTVSCTSSDSNVATIVGGMIHIVGTGTCTIYADQSGNNVYLSAAQASQTLTVTKASLTVTADSKTKVYGDTNPALSFRYSGWKNGVETIDTPPAIVTTINTTTAAGTYTGAITLSGGLDNNYTFSYVPANMEVTKAMLTVIADAKSKTRGAANPELTYQYRGWRNGEETIDTPPTITTTVNRTTVEGNYVGAITLSGGSDNNYLFDYVAGDFEVTAPKIAGDKDGNGVIDGSELAGDRNGDGKITAPEILGDLNGNGQIDDGEIAGDRNGNGRIDSDETRVIDPARDHVNVDHLFSPNGDGMNDYWKLPEIEELGRVYVKIYNRWGTLLYESTNYQNDWDGTSQGKAVPEGGYIYFIRTEKGQTKNGVVNLVR